MNNEMMMVINCLILVLSLGNIMFLMKESGVNKEILNVEIVHPASFKMNNNNKN